MKLLLRAGNRLQQASLACALFVACATAAATDGGWTMRMAVDQEVIYKGMPLGDSGGDARPMVYPGGVAGLVGGLIGHGLAVGMMRSNAETESEKRANKVIDPYRAGLAGFTGRELGRAALSSSTLKGASLSGLDEAAGVKVADAVTEFYLTQDSDALVLDNTIVVAQDSSEPWRNVIRVVSEPHPADGWGSDAAALKAESAKLLALSLDIAIAQATAPAPASGGQQRTIRYKLGAKEVFERAELLQERCGRALIRNLRGNLMSVPLSRPLSVPDTGCMQ